MARTQPTASRGRTYNIRETDDNGKVNTMDLTHRPEMSQTVSVTSKPRPNRSESTKHNNRGKPSGSANDNVQSSESNRKCLSNWVLRLQEIKSLSANSKFVVILSGTILLNETPLEENHNAGVLMDRIDKKLVKTTNGLYQLLGPVADAFPKSLYKGCVKSKGIPCGWKSFLTDTATRKSNITAQHIYQYMIQEGAISNQKGIVYSEHGSLSKIDIYCTAIKQLNRLLAKTPEKILKYRKFNTPTDILKYKFHKKMIYTYKSIIDKVKKEEKILETP